MRRNALDPIQRGFLAPGALAIIDLMEAEWRNLSEKADIAYELGMLDEAEIIDAHADALAEWLDGAVAEIEEGGDLDIYGQEAHPSIEEQLSDYYRRYCCGGEHGRITREELVKYVRMELGSEPTFKRDISDDIIVEAARDAYEARVEYRLRLKKKTGPYTKNPPSWVTDEEAWERAYESVEPYWERYDEPWAVVAFVYKRIVAAKERRARSERARKAALARWGKGKKRAKKKTKRKPKRKAARKR